VSWHLRQAEGDEEACFYGGLNAWTAWSLQLSVTVRDSLQCMERVPRAQVRAGRPCCYRLAHA
jgi:hypothetical protein